MAVLGRIIVAAFVPITLFVFYMFCEYQRAPYIDETFHFPQALKYFYGKYLEWNPKITTPPGLYIISNGLLLPLYKLTGVNVSYLTCFRAINVLFSVGNFFVIRLILQKLHHKDTLEDMFLLSSLNIMMLPTLYFFSFLYYTDCGSVFFVLLMYLCHLNQHQWIAAIFGAVSILFRQTNIIWMFFAAAHPVHQILVSKSQKIPSAPKVRLSSTKSRSSNFFRKQRTKIIFYIQYWMPIISDIIYINIGYIVTAVSFVFFVFVNKSVVLGDKAAHEPGFNIPQVFYFVLFSLFFASPHMITVPNIRAFLRLLAKYTFLVILVAAGVALSIRYLTYEHPYLLSDNRHYTFYIWKRILNRNVYLTHLLIPVSIFGGWAILHLIRHKDTMWKSLFVFCVLLSIVPQRLFELRYFNTAFVLFRLHIKLKSPTQAYLEFALFAIVNAVTFYLFLERPFLSDGVLQRFMW